MKPLLDRLKTGAVLVSDGATGTMLQARGLGAGESPEAWCVARPDAVAEIAAEYVAAGADIIETNSFGGTTFKQRVYGLADRCDEFAVAAARLARTAAKDAVYAAGSIGPTGQIAEDEGGEIAPEQMYEAFKRQVIALAKGGVNVFCIETMSSRIEAAQAVKAACENSDLPVICTFTFERRPKGYRTMMGVTPQQAVEAALEAGADVVGANCGNGIAQMVELATLMRETSPATPLLFHANAGLPVLENGRPVFKETPETMAALVPDLIAAGANIIGGCCGTGPAHIKAIASAVQQWNRSRPLH